MPNASPEAPTAAAPPKVETTGGQSGGTEKPKNALREMQAALSKKFGEKISKFRSKPELDPKSVLEEVAKEKPTEDKLPKDRTRRFLKGRLTDSDKQWALSNEHKDDVDTRIKQLTPETEGEQSDRKQRKIFVKAVHDSRQAPVDELAKQAKTAEDIALQKIDATRNDEAFKAALRAELRRRQVNNGGKPVGIRGQIAAERQLLIDSVQNRPVTAEQKAQAKVDTDAAEQQRTDDAAAAEQQSAEAKAKEKEIEGLKARADYKATRAAAFKDLTPDGLTRGGKLLTGEEIRAVTAQADEAALNTLRERVQQEIQANKDTYVKDKADALANGTYHRVLAEMLDDKPELADNPNFDEIVANQAIARMKEAKAAKTTPVEPPAGEARADSPAATAEAVAKTPKEILEGLDIDPTEAMGKKVLKAIEANPDSAEAILAKVTQAKVAQGELDKLNKGLEPPIDIDSKVLFNQALQNVAAQFTNEIAKDVKEGRDVTAKSKVMSILKEIMSVAVEIAAAVAFEAAKAAVSS
jgi:hypothetical protein